jgi:hypothetical protein
MGPLFEECKPLTRKAADQPKRLPPRSCRGCAGSGEARAGLSSGHAQILLPGLPDRGAILE